MHSHWLDRFMNAIRWPLIVAAVASVPVFLFSYARMALLAYETWPIWAFSLAAFAHVIAWLGVASLFDTRQSQSQRQEPDR